jgi:hypothetical protein
MSAIDAIFKIIDNRSWEAVPIVDGIKAKIRCDNCKHYHVLVLQTGQAYGTRPGCWNPENGIAPAGRDGPAWPKLNPKPDFFCALFEEKS